jgi:S-adenosyl-L-methionine hydrolase (adenosine-forming)
MPSSRPIVTLTTDFGSGSYVAQMKGVILGYAPSVNLVDVTHDIEPQNIEQASLVLAEAVPSFPSHSIHLAVVDPGVGSQRAILYFELGNWRFVMPDNGLITGLAEKYPIHRIVRLTESRYWARAVSPTFHGRDIMAHVVGHLCNGVAPEVLGKPRTTYQPTIADPPQKTGDTIVGKIQSIDHFGNGISNITRKFLLQSFGIASFDASRCQVDVPGIVQRLPIIKTYSQNMAGTTIALFDSQDRVEIAVVEGNAAAELSFKVGQEIVVRRLNRLQ